MIAGENTVFELLPAKPAMLSQHAFTMTGEYFGQSNDRQSDNVGCLNYHGLPTTLTLEAPTEVGHTRFSS
jgi:hypothetical protein